MESSSGSRKRARRGWFGHALFRAHRQPGLRGQLRSMDPRRRAPGHQNRGLLFGVVAHGPESISALPRRTRMGPKASSCRSRTVPPRAISRLAKSVLESAARRSVGLSIWSGKNCSSVVQSGSTADQISKPAQRVLHRPQGQRPRRVRRTSRPAPDRIQIGADERAGLDHDARAVIFVVTFRRATREHVLAEHRARRKPGGQSADDVHLAQPSGEGLRGHFAAFQVVVGDGGHQQAGFQPCQPRGHDQPVGGQFQADAPARPRSPPGIGRPARGSRSSPDRPSGHARGRAAGPSDPRTPPAEERGSQNGPRSRPRRCQMKFPSIPSTLRPASQNIVRNAHGRTLSRACPSGSTPVRRGRMKTTSSTITMPAFSSLAQIRANRQRQ